MGGVNIANEMSKNILQHGSSAVSDNVKELSSSHVILVPEVNNPCHGPRDLKETDFT